MRESILKKVPPETANSSGEWTHVLGSGSHPAAEERVWKTVSAHHVHQVIQDIVENSMQLLASERCALDLW